MELNAVPIGKSLKFDCRAAPNGKITSSPGCGGRLPTQFAGVDQRLFKPPPSQIAGARRSSSRTKRRALARGRFLMDVARRHMRDGTEQPGRRPPPSNIHPAISCYNELTA